MVKNKIFMAVLGALLACMFSACSKNVVPSTLAYRSSYETEIISKDPSGAVTLRVWGEGHDLGAARTNAAKKAVEEVTFSNITSNKATSLAIIPGPTVRANNADYFNKFFKDGGKYKKFVKAEKPEKEEVLNGNKQVVVPMIITVDREGLVKQYKKDKITN